MSSTAGVRWVSLFIAVAATLCSGFEAASTPSFWAVIAVGTRGYNNYRHQADACHAYQVLRLHGVPEDQIILLMQDDVAGSPANPFMGALYNREGDNVTDVYSGCKVDYRGQSVTAELFMKVLTGNASGLSGGKVLRSGATDRVFVNLLGNAGVGVVSFPNGPPLHVSDLSATFQSMTGDKRFGELLLYVDGSNAGSLFQSLSSNSKILAVSSANRFESSFGAYCMPDHDVVLGQHMGTCLGDLFSVSWLEDLERSGNSESIQNQIQHDAAADTESHVAVHGDRSFESQPMFPASSLAGVVPRNYSAQGTMNVHDIPLQAAFAAWRATRREVDKDAAWLVVQAVEHAQSKDEAAFTSLVQAACRSDQSDPRCAYDMKESRQQIVDASCHKALVMELFASCPARSSNDPGGWNSFNLKFSQILVNLCESKARLQQSTEQLVNIVSQVCHSASQEVVLV